jgi:hypothetical protein
MAVCLQPFLISTLLDEENTGKGLNGRIVFAYPAPRAGTRKAKSTTPAIYKKYDKAIFYTLEKILEITEPKTIKLSDEADKYAENYFYTPEKRIDDGLQNAISWNGKAFGLSIRIAALFHAFQCYEDNQEPADIPISAETMKNAAEVVECLAAHAEKVFAGENEQTSNAFYLLRRMKRYGQHTIPKTKIWQGVKKRLRHATTLNDTLSYLEERGYVKIERSQTGGRPSETIKVNPAFLNDNLIY